jgi:glycerol-1-phosphate dehydrogenase [NAD(P)+]
MNEKIPMADCLAAAETTRDLLTGPQALEAIPELLKKHFDSPESVFLVADENTYEAEGKAAEKILTAAGISLAGSYIFSGTERVHAEYHHVETLKQQFQSVKNGKGFVPLVVGTGTLNDLVKRSSWELKLPYFCIASAASVDGFTADGAAIVYEEFKQTLPCDAPRVLAADINVLAQAPAFLTASGFGDLAGKIIGGSDWIIADRAFALDGKGIMAPGSEAIDRKGWSMVQNGLWETLEASLPAAKGDRNAVKLLFESLAVTGFAIQYFKTSRPSSGCEHLFSHVWEMENLSVDGIPVTHGHKVAMGTLAASAFTECLFSRTEPPAALGKRPSAAEREAEIRKAFAGLDKAAEAALKTSMSKFLDDQKARLLADALRDCWKEIREACLAHLPPYGKFLSLLKEGGCPVKPEKIGLQRSHVIASAAKAQMIRKRYTALDLAWDLGIFEDVQKLMEESPLYLR